MAMSKVNYTFIIIFLILSVPLISAQEIVQRCLNSSYLETKIEWVECDSTCESKNWTQPAINCTYGCDPVDEECKEPPYKINLYIIAIIGVIIIVMAIILKKT